jgi:hypothetical protein
MAHAHYLYLDPVNIDAHKARLMSKKGEEVNYLDPQTDEAMMEQIYSYREIANETASVGILGSTNVRIFGV